MRACCSIPAMAQAELDPARLDAAGVIRISMDGAGGRGGLRRLAGAPVRGRVAAGHARGHGFPVFRQAPPAAQAHQASIGAGQPLFPRRRGAQQRLEGLSARIRSTCPPRHLYRAGALEHGRAARRRQLRDAGKFDAAAALAAIAAHRVTHSQWVPTMFIRCCARRTRNARAMTRPPLAAGARGRAVPGRSQAGHDPLVGADPVRVLQRHRAGRAHSLGSEEWLAHPGSVGRPEFAAYRQRGRRAGTAAGAAGRHLFRAAAPRIPQGSGQDARRQTRAAGPPMATSATWTRTAICT